MTCHEYHDLVAAHVDGQLSPAELHAVNTHLSSCASCRERFAEEQQFHLAFASRRALLSPSPAVMAKLHEALARESLPFPSWRQRFFSYRERLFSFLSLPRVATAAVVTAVLLIYWWFPSTNSDLLTVAAEQYEIAATDQRVFSYVQSDPQKLEKSFNASGELDFTTHVLNLRAVGYRIRGGNIVRLHGHPTALTVYRGKEADLVCLRQRGTLPPLPPGAMQIGRDVVYSYKQYTILMTQESDLFCILIARLPRDVFLQSFGHHS